MGFVFACVVAYVAFAVVITRVAMTVRALSRRDTVSRLGALGAKLESAQSDVARIADAFDQLEPLRRRVALAGAEIALSVGGYREALARMRGSAPF